MTPAPITFENAFQTAYVTRDLEQAIAQFSAGHAGIEWTRIPAGDLELRIPAGARVSLKVGVAWLGGFQIELIEPVSGAVDIYRQALPAQAGALEMHHLGMRIEGDRSEWDRFRAGVPDERVAIEGGREQMRFIYTDERATLGHYLEYVWMSDAFVAANPVWRKREKG